MHAQHLHSVTFICENLRTYLGHLIISIASNHSMMQLQVVDFVNR